MSRLAATVTLVAIADTKESLKCPVSLGLRKKEQIKIDTFAIAKEQIKN